MELFNYYSLDECVDKKEVLKRLKSLKKDGKIEFNLDGEVFEIKDIDLEEEEVGELVEMFDKMDVFPYLERDEEEDDDDYYDYGYGDDEDY
jgi:hypothetical protein